jgi:hypothetical protein
MFNYRKFTETNWMPPYTTKNGRKVIALEKTGTGVYLIKKNGRIVYVGKASNHIKKTLYRHFQTWTDLRSTYGRKLSPYERVTYKDVPGSYLIKVIYTHTSREADILEQALILKVQPRDNSLKLMLFTQRQVDEVIEKLDEAPFKNKFVRTD